MGPTTREIISIREELVNLLQVGQVSRRQWEAIMGKLNFATQILRSTRPLLQPLLRPQLLSGPKDRDLGRPLEALHHPVEHPGTSSPLT